jgi:D(-)-tartrate dehydratase
MRMTQIREKTALIASPISNAYIDFSKMTCSVVAVVTDVVRNGMPVVASPRTAATARVASSGERFRPRILEAEPKTMIDQEQDNLDPAKIWACMMTNEKAEIIF